MRVLRSVLILALVFLPSSPFATTFPVTKTADTNDGICDADCSLREALFAANNNGGADEIILPRVPTYSIGRTQAALRRAWSSLRSTSSTISRSVEPDPT